MLCIIGTACSRSQGYEHVYAQRRGTDLRSYGGGGGAPIPAARSSADTAGGPEGLPRGKFEKKRWWHLVVFAVKILIYKF